MAHRQILALLEQQRRLELKVEELTRIATTDELTGLRNRRYFAEDVRSAFVHARSEGSTFSLVLLDVDHFKVYNDTFGHQAGDRVLTLVAGLMGRHARNGDLAIRLGGEEFILILPGADERQSSDVAEAIRTSVQSFRWPQGTITASLGVSTMRPCTEHAGDLIEEADVALYFSKRHGRNRSSHYKDLTNHPIAARSPSALMPAKRLVDRRRLRDLST